jgi:hypothetical protein
LYEQKDNKLPKKAEIGSIHGDKAGYTDCACGGKESIDIAELSCRKGTRQFQENGSDQYHCYEKAKNDDPISSYAYCQNDVLQS